MDEKILHEAVENISLIKGVIDRTSKSFIAFSKIFIYWGLLFILNSVITLLMILNREQAFEIAMRYPALNFIFPVGIITLLAVLIYRAVSKKIPLVGLEKHLMKVWVLVLAMNVLPPKISINTANAATDPGSISVYASNFSVMLFSLAIALIVTSLFTGYKQLSYIGAIYITISVLHAYLNLAIFEGSLIQLLSLILLPLTFLYTGFFLKSQQARRN
ncbi:MAG: hypothetical protein N3B21_13420 [Clostridia bacterium]|nr:hypothetical protein [Clostridia bacterium]